MSRTKRKKNRRFAMLFLLGTALILPGCGRKPEPEYIDDEGHRMILLAKVADDLGVTMGKEQVDGDDALTLSRGNLRLRFHPSAAVIHVNDTPVFSDAAPRLFDGHPYIRHSDLETIVRPLLRPDLLSRREPVRKILIDPGHGGKDPGAVNTEFGLREKDLALRTARRFAANLHRAGFVVALTRDDDRFIPLSERPEIANDFGADLFISLHFNAAQNPEARGIEVFILNPAASDPTQQPLPGNAGDKWNTLLGYSIQNSLIEATDQANRGVKRARFAVLRTLNCPGLLVEGGFVSNADDARLLQSEDWLQNLADAIAHGVKDYTMTLLHR